MRNRKQFKALSAGVGLAAVAVMAVLGVTMGEQPDSTQNLVGGPMNTGATVTQSKAANKPEVSVAKPPFTFTTPEGFAVPH